MSRVRSTFSEYICMKERILHSDMTEIKRKYSVFIQIPSVNLDDDK